VLENHGILSYRGTPDTWLHRGRSERHNPGYLSLLRYAESVWGNVGYNCYSLSRQSLSYPLNIPASRFLYPCYPSLLWCDALRCRRIQNELSHASKRGLLYHLWWHPHNFGAELERNIEHLRIILDHFVSLRDNGEMISMSMGELAKLLQPKAHEDTPNPDLLMSTALGGAGSWKFHPMRLDTHIHSKYSHDSLSDPMRILKVARKKRLDAISITDHGTMQAYSPGFHSSDPLVIPGMEMKTNRGDVIGLFLSEPPEGADFLEICDQIRTQGGIVVLPHPYRRSCDPIELVSHVDLIEVLNSRSRKQENARALALSHRFDAGPITGSDAHTYFEIGRAVTEVDGIYGDLDELRRVLLRADRQCFGSTSSYYVSRGFSFGAEMLKKVRR
jgi:predicted metal-dependent phosphoesterase TrpH